MSGSSRKALVAILRSSEIRNAGSKIRLEHIATSNVTDNKIPSDAVPPKLEAENIKNPKKRIIAVYTMLTPVSLIVKDTALEILSG